MSEALLEERESNPYNMKKPWHEADQGPSQQADEVYYEEDQPKATRKKKAAPSEEESPQQETNYKKRYDDLKRHYDAKLNEFRQREQELVAASQPVYEAPKSEEDLTRFREEYPDLYDTVETVVVVVVTPAVVVVVVVNPAPVVAAVSTLPSITVLT